MCLSFSRCKRSIRICNLLPLLFLVAAAVQDGPKHRSKTGPNMGATSSANVWAATSLPDAWPWAAAAGGHLFLHVFAFVAWEHFAVCVCFASGKCDGGRSQQRPEVNQNHHPGPTEGSAARAAESEWGEASSSAASAAAAGDDLFLHMFAFGALREARHCQVSIVLSLSWCILPILRMTCDETSPGARCLGAFCCLRLFGGK